jgi:hypothetical protein
MSVQHEALAGLHCSTPSVFPIERIAHLGMAGGCCDAGFDPANDRYGSIASDRHAHAARFTPIVPKHLRRSETSLRANWRPEQVQQIYLDKTALVDHLVGER